MRWGWDMYLSSPLHPRLHRWAAFVFGGMQAGTRSESDYRAQLAQPPPRHRETIADLDLLLLGCPAVFVALVAPCPHISI